eukprot:4798115-Pyramimonas_sp.AAC.1
MEDGEMEDGDDIEEGEDDYLYSTDDDVSDPEGGARARSIGPLPGIFLHASAPLASSSSL